MVVSAVHSQVGHSRYSQHPHPHPNLTRRFSSPSSTASRSVLEGLLTRCARELAIAGREGFEGGPGRVGATQTWVEAATDLAAVKIVLAAVDPAAIQARTTTRNVALNAELLLTKRAAALTEALAASTHAASLLRRYRGFSARSKNAAAHAMLDDYNFIKSVLLPALELKAAKIKFVPGESVTILFKRAYVRACSAATRLVIQRDRISVKGRARSGKAAGMGKTHLKSLYRELAAHLKALATLQPRMPSAVRQWAIPTVASACLPGAFPAKLGDLHLTDSHDLATLLALRNRRDRLAEHLDLLAMDVDDGIKNVLALRAALTARLTLLASGDASGLTTALGGDSLFGAATSHLSPKSLCLYGGKVVYEGRARADALLAQLKRLKAALDLLPTERTSFKLREVSGRTVWEREGGRMLRGDITPHEWMGRALLSSSGAGCGVEDVGDVAGAEELEEADSDTNPESMDERDFESEDE